MNHEKLGRAARRGQMLHPKIDPAILAIPAAMLAQPAFARIAALRPGLEFVQACAEQPGPGHSVGALGCRVGVDDAQALRLAQQGGQRQVQEDLAMAGR